MNRSGWSQRIDIDGYICRRGRSQKQPIPRWHREWLGKQGMTINIKGLPEKYWGKRITIRVEVVKEQVEGGDNEWLRIC